METGPGVTLAVTLDAEGAQQLSAPLGGALGSWGCGS